MRDAFRKEAHDGAVARRLRIELGDGADAAAARAVLDDDVGVARDVPLDVVGGKPRVKII